MGKTAMTTEDIQNRLKAYLKEHYGIADVTPETRFKTELGLDSLDFINLMLYIEDTFHIEIDEEAYRFIQTAGELTAHILERMK